jgi:peptidyl-tRNA hydrolase ICT1
MYSRPWHLPVLHQLRYFTTRSDVQVARDWLTGLNRQTIPRHICEVSFSRSSGPGGQNVNKSVIHLEDPCRRLGADPDLV